MSTANPDAGAPALEAIVLATPDEMGADRYREWCRVAELFSFEGPYAAFLITLPDGPRVTQFTVHLEWARSLLADNVRAGGGLVVDVDPGRFFGWRPGWPKDWASALDAGDAKGPAPG